MTKCCPSSDMITNDTTAVVFWLMWNLTFLVLPVSLPPQTEPHQAVPDLQSHAGWAEGHLSQRSVSRGQLPHHQGWRCRVLETRFWRQVSPNSHRFLGIMFFFIVNSEILLLQVEVIIILCVLQDHRALEGVPSVAPWVPSHQLWTGGHGPQVHHRPHLQRLYLCLWVWHLHQAISGN